MKYPGMEFSKDEILANEIFIDLRDKTLQDEIPSDFLQKTYKYFDEFKNYSMFKLIRTIPKTSIFHIHSDVCCKPDWLLAIFEKHKDKIYTRENKHFYYFDGPPPEETYTLVRKLREESGNPEEFDQRIKDQIVLLPKDIESMNPKDLWDKFILGLVSCFGVILH